MERNLIPCFSTVVAEAEKEIFEKVEEALRELDNGKNYWATSHHFRISSLLNETEMYVYPFRWNECFGYHLYRWILWLPIRSLFWKVFRPISGEPLKEETIETIIDLLLPFSGFIPHTSIYDVKEYLLSGIRLFYSRNSDRIPYNLSLYVVSEEVRLDREPYFLVPKIEKNSLLLLLDIFDTMYYHPDPDLRHYTERFDYSELYKKYVLESTNLLYREGIISSDAAYQRVMKLFQPYNSK